MLLCARCPSDSHVLSLSLASVCASRFGESLARLRGSGSGMYSGSEISADDLCDIARELANDHRAWRIDMAGSGISPNVTRRRRDQGGREAWSLVD